MTGGGAVVAWWGVAGRRRGIFIYFLFKIFNWTDMWGFCPPQQKDFIFCHVSLTSGSHRSVSLSIGRKM
jgi:hypothetical protein